MGKGDRKTNRGKIANGSFGKSRPARKATVAGSAPAEKPSEEKVPAKKAKA